MGRPAPRDVIERVLLLCLQRASSVQWRVNKGRLVISIQFSKRRVTYLFLLPQGLLDHHEAREILEACEDLFFEGQAWKKLFARIL